MDRHWVLVVALIEIVLAIIPQDLAVAADITVEDRIAAVTSGLLPAFEIKSVPKSWKLADRMAHYKTPAVSVAVIDHYEIEWARAWGVTQAGGKTRVMPDTSFTACSISKAVTALGALDLVRQGKLDLDTDVNSKLREWKLPENEFTRSKKVTLRELLSHSAGTTVWGFAGHPVGSQVPTLLQVLDGIPPANNPPVRVEAVPGSRWSYSGGGYEIVQQLMMDVTGEPFPKLMQRLVLKPLGMTHSTYEQPLPIMLQTAAAMGTLSSGARLPGGRLTYPEMAAAGLWTTPSDLARFAIVLMKAKRGADSRISPATATAMLTPQIKTGISWFEDDGLGVFVAGHDQGARFFHWGGGGGFTAQLIGYESGQGAVVLTNSDSGMPLSEEITRSIAHEYGWPDFKPQPKTLAIVPASVSRQYVGQYQLVSPYIGSVTMNVVQDASGLFAIVNGDKDELFAESPTRFFTTGGIEIAFVLDQKGTAVACDWHHPHGFGGRANRTEQ